MQLAAGVDWAVLSRPRPDALSGVGRFPQAEWTTVFRDEAIEIVGPGRCLVWATIVRDGTPRTGFNRALESARSEHPNVRLVEWAVLVGEQPNLLGADLVHGTPEGYARRAEETARVVRGCPRP